MNVGHGWLLSRKTAKGGQCLHTENNEGTVLYKTTTTGHGRTW
jgi:hypothetical protein